ncbi:hypothetical protein [Neptunicella marina]|uniref:Uncharacterized protein n=1 Tax=Neptunicella marina TaxID=2125989 RepID=A0A8J6IUB4_9ALTE|nr:hypothetical protein [Neptunicella marina]MBC3766052.1 hypothetical protein [Neptunicella marina]
MELLVIVIIGFAAWIGWQLRPGRPIDSLEKLQFQQCKIHAIAACQVTDDQGIKNIAKRIESLFEKVQKEHEYTAETIKPLQKEVESLVHTMHAELTKLGVKDNFDTHLRNLLDKIYPDSSPATSSENSKNVLKNEAGTEALVNAMQNASSAMDFVTENFEEFAELRKTHEAEFAINFVWLEVAVIIAGERINKGIDESEFANHIFQAGLSFGEEGKPKTAVFTDDRREVFFGSVNAYLGAIAKFIDSAKASQIDPGPGALLLRHLMNSVKGKDNLSDEEIGKCHIIGSELSTSILRYIFDGQERTKTDEPQQSNEFLSQRLDDAAERCGVPLQEFLGAYQAYLTTLRGDGNWNDDIDSNALRLDILTENEIENAKSNIKQAALNRTIYRFEYPKSLSI